MERDDFRAQIRSDTSSCAHGRHCLRLRLPSAGKALLAVPLRSSSVGAEGSGLSWRLSLQLRASPAPAALSVVSGGGYQGAVRNASGWFGNDYIPCARGSSQVGKVLGSADVPVAGWRSVSIEFTNDTLHSQNLWLNVTTAARLGTRVWLDEVSLVNATAGG